MDIKEVYLFLKSEIVVSISLIFSHSWSSLSFHFVTFSWYIFLWFSSESILTKFNENINN